MDSFRGRCGLPGRKHIVYIQREDLRTELSTRMDDGTLWRTYSYDAWGNILSVQTTSGIEITSAADIANLQSLKYRGYVYDRETGFYYLQSRYYDPVTHRFINADGYISTGQGIIGNNVFVYCDNNPVLNVDFNGYRYCEATTVRDENKENRKISCQFRSNRIIDITNRLNSAMINNAQTLREKLNAVRQISRYSGTDLSFVVTFDFIDRVRPNGEWDFKSQEEWNLSPNYLYQYNNHILRYDDIGNIHYGYVGRELFSTNALLWAGGVVQVCTGTSKWEYWQSCFDDPRDQEMIYFGSQLWDMNS